MSSGTSNTTSLISSPYTVVMTNNKQHSFGVVLLVTLWVKYSPSFYLTLHIEVWSIIYMKLLRSAALTCQIIKVRTIVCIWTYTIHVVISPVVIIKILTIQQTFKSLNIYMGMWVKDVGNITYFQPPSHVWLMWSRVCTDVWVYHDWGWRSTCHSRVLTAETAKYEYVDVAIILTGQEIWKIDV